MQTTFTPYYFPFYRVRVTSDMPGFRLTDYGLKLFSAKREATLIRDTTDMTATLEAYDRFTGETLRTVRY